MSDKRLTEKRGNNNRTALGPLYTLWAPFIPFGPPLYPLDRFGSFRYLKKNVPRCKKCLEKMHFSLLLSVLGVFSWFLGQFSLFSISIDFEKKWKPKKKKGKKMKNEKWRKKLFQAKKNSTLLYFWGFLGPQRKAQVSGPILSENKIWIDRADNYGCRLHCSGTKLSAERKIEY